MEFNFKEYIELDAQIKELQSKQKTMKAQLVKNEKFVSEQIGNVKVSRIVSRSMVLSKDVDQDMIMEEFPDCVVKSLDVKKLKDTPDAHSLFEEKQVVSVRVSVLKEANADDEDF